MTSTFSWQNSISLCPTSFCTPRPNLPVTPGVSWLPTFAFQSPIMTRTSFLGVSSKRSCRSSYTHTEIVQSCPTLWDPMDYSLPGSLFHGILQAWILEWVAISSSRASSWPRDRNWVSRIVGRRFTVWATMEVLQLQLLQRYWLGHRLGLLWYWMVCLETNRDHSVVFEIASKYCISDSFVDHDGYSISSERFLPAIVDIMVIWVKFTHSSPF